jgi:hypothetical protein
MYRAMAVTRDDQSTTAVHDTRRAAAEERTRAQLETSQRLQREQQIKKGGREGGESEGG